jgi:diguanylate cyclase (GGDEF)-like protein/PAS domain S-box-containing protein
MSTIEPNPEKLQYIFDNAKIGIALYNVEENTLEMVNPAFTRIYGYESSELIGVSLSDLFSLKGMAKFKEYGKTISDTSDDVTFETTHIRKDSSFADVSVNITLIKNSNGSIKYRIINIIDITEQKIQQKNLLSRERDFRNVSENSPNIIVRYDRDCRIIYVNQAYLYQTGIPREHAINSRPEDIWDTYLCMLTLNAKEYQDKIKQVIESGEPDYFTLEWHRLSDGEYVVHEFYLSVEYDMNERVIGVLVVGNDITERKKSEVLLAQKESRLAEAQKIAKTGSWELEFPGLKLTWSDEFYRIFEMDADHYTPSYDHILNTIHPEERAQMDLLYHASLKSKTSLDTMPRLLMNDGRIKYIHMKAETFYNKQGKPQHTIGTVQDITERKSIEKKIEYMAHHDALTGLPNRTLAKERAEQILAYTGRSHLKAAFLFIDLDGFKAINDALGHFTGDMMLKSVASRLKECIRDRDTISRLEGDEFLVVLSDIKELDIVVSIVKKILAELEKSVEINTHALSLSCSIGIALYPDHGETFESLLQSADTAMYKTKDLGKNSYCFYTEQMKHNLIGEFKLKNDLKIAIQNNEFILFYQPQIDLKQNRIVGAEALIRWQHPQMGMLPPMHFIGLSESSGLIVQIGQWVIEEACRQAAKWQNEGKEIIIAVNISAAQFKRGNLEAVVKNALASSGLTPRLLELELTESILINDAENVLKSVQLLKGLGVQLSIDDFGTGYSSLSYLKRFAVDKLKIDQSFVRGILEDQDDAVIVKTIIQMAKNLNLKTIAEGVENGEVLAVIDSYGCDEVQGYHFAKPMPSSDFDDYCHQFEILK